MRHTEKRIQPAREFDHVVKVTCDMCGQDVEPSHDFVVDEVEIRHKKGVAYPEGGDGKEVTFDVCGKCFETKLVPWLESQGAAPTKTEWDY